MDLKLIVFGCGKLGHEAIDVLGEENVECFCDNNPALIGSEQYGKRVISFEELTEQYKDAAVIICANIRRGNSYAMAEQCEKYGIQDYFFIQMIRDKEFFTKRDKLLLFLQNSANRKELKCEMYIKRVEELQKQADYLKRHIDIRHILPAGGKLREWQLLLVKVSAELLDKLEELDIKPFLYSGNLIGYVRHNGFVPWDDDIDFGLIRGEYERLRKYCRLYMYSEEEFYGREKCSREVREELKGYYWGNGGGDEFNIYYILPDGRKISIDFFVIDYYAQDYSYEALMQMREKVKLKLNDAIAENPGGMIYDDKKRIKCFQEALKEISVNLVEESDHIYFGIDCMDMYHSYHGGEWIPKEVVFPLKKVLYEGAYFYVPNDAERFANYEYENIWALPDDVGIPQHIGNAGDVFTDMDKW